MNCAMCSWNRWAAPTWGCLLFAWTELHDYSDFQKRLAWSLNCLLTKKNCWKRKEDCLKLPNRWGNSFFLLNRWSLLAKHGRIPRTWGRRVPQWPQQRLPLLVAAAAAAATLGQAVALTALSQVHQCLLFLWPQSPPQRPSQVPHIKAVVSRCVVPSLCFLRGWIPFGIV